MLHLRHCCISSYPSVTRDAFMETHPCAVLFGLPCVGRRFRCSLAWKYLLGQAENTKFPFCLSLDGNTNQWCSCGQSGYSCSFPKFPSKLREIILMGSQKMDSKGKAPRYCQYFNMQDTTWRRWRGTVVRSTLCVSVCGLQLGKLWFSGSFPLKKEN